jgi:hypothetical protein
MLIQNAHGDLTRASPMVGREEAAGSLASGEEAAEDFEE